MPTRRDDLPVHVPDADLDRRPHRVLLRTSRAGQDLFSEVQQQVWSIDKELPLYKSTTLATLVSDSLAQRRFTMLSCWRFSALRCCWRRSACSA